MSIANEIERIGGLKERLGAKLQGMGLASPVPSLEASVEAVEGIVDNGAVQGSIDGMVLDTYTIPQGYHSGSGKVQLAGTVEAALAAI